MIRADCLNCGNNFELDINLNAIGDPKVCPECNISYYTMNGSINGLTIENCLVDNRELSAPNL